MKFILGKKIEMSQLFEDDGTVVPVTIVKVGPCQVTQVRTCEKDGYLAFQVGFGQKKRINKSVSGHLKGLPKFRHIAEFRVVSQVTPNKSSNCSNEKEEVSGILKRGDVVKADVFKAGDIVKVAGVSKGKGFQGVVKRHGFHGSPASHGHKDQLRMPGSIGSTDPARVFPGMRMAGRMGGESVTVANLEVMKVDKDKELLYIKGAVPGGRNSLLKIFGPGELKVEIQENNGVEDDSDKLESKKNGEGKK